MPPQCVSVKRFGSGSQCRVVPSLKVVNAALGRLQPNVRRMDREKRPINWTWSLLLLFLRFGCISQRRGTRL